MFCAKHHQNVFDDTEDDGSTGPWQTNAALGDFSWSNYREAYRARSKSEFIAKCGDSLRELEETAYWLELLVEGKIVPAETVAVMRRECDELLAIFVTILKRSKDTS